MATSAGFLLRATDTGRVLLLLRSLDGGSPAVWSIPGGHIEAGESEQEGGLRELLEETGYSGPLHVFGRVVHEGYVTYLAHVPSEFDADLNDEHIDAGWFAEHDLPTPLHRGVVIALGEAA